MKTVEKLVRALYSAKSYEEVHELVVNYARLHGAPIDPPLKLKHPRKMYYKETFSDGYGNDSEEYKEVSDVSDAKLYSSESKGHRQTCSCVRHRSSCKVSTIVQSRTLSFVH